MPSDLNRPTGVTLAHHQRRGGWLETNHRTKLYDKNTKEEDKKRRQRKKTKRESSIFFMGVKVVDGKFGPVQHILSPRTGSSSLFPSCTHGV